MHIAFLLLIESVCQSTESCLPSTRRKEVLKLGSASCVTNVLGRCAGVLGAGVLQNAGRVSEGWREETVVQRFRAAAWEGEAGTVPSHRQSSAKGTQGLEARGRHFHHWPAVAVQGLPHRHFQSEPLDRGPQLSYTSLWEQLCCTAYKNLGDFRGLCAALRFLKPRMKQGITCCPALPQASYKAGDYVLPASLVHVE